MDTGKYNLDPHNKYFHFKTIGVHDIREVTVKIKTSNRFNLFLKLAIPFIERSLAFSFNTSLKTSHFPALWKSACITPILKDGYKAPFTLHRCDMAPVRLLLYFD